MAGGNREPGQSVTAKVLAIIGVFETSRRSLSLTEISKASGVPLSTTHRLVAELVDAGMLARGPHGGIQLGLRLWAIAQNTGRQLRDTAKPYIQDLHNLTQEMSQLAVRDGDSALYIERIYGSSRVPKASRVGGRLPLHVTAVGKVILAFDEPWVRAAYLEHPLARMTAYSHVDVRRLSAELDEVREREYATTAEEVRLGSASIAVPVWHTGKLGCSIGIVVASDKASTMERHLPVLRGVALKIEKATAPFPLETLLGAVKEPHQAMADEPVDGEAPDS